MASDRRGAKGAHVGPMVFPDPSNRNLTKCLKQQQQQALTVHLSLGGGAVTASVGPVFCFLPSSGLPVLMVPHGLNMTAVPHHY